MNKKIYLAGPDVFRSDANAYFEILKDICKKYGYIGLSPFDNENFNGKLFSKYHSVSIFNSNFNLIKECDIVIANLIPFRGPNVDDGTAWEIGCAFTLNKVIYGYTETFNQTLKQKTYNNFDLKNQPEFNLIESFGINSVNLMIQESIELSGGCIARNFKDCILYDFNKNKLINE
jgi:nucleoside 2-deoxyribosyltransferase